MKSIVALTFDSKHAGTANVRCKFNDILLNMFHHAREIFSMMFLQALLLFAILFVCIPASRVSAATSKNISRDALREMNSALTGNVPSQLIPAAFNSASSTPSTELLRIAKERKNIMRILAKSDPRTFLTHSLSTKDRSSVNASVRAFVEEQKTIRGAIHVIHSDDFKDQKNSEYKYSMTLGGVETKITPTEQMPLLSSGDTVSFEGAGIGDTFVARTHRVISRLTQPGQSTGDQRMLVVLITYPDKTPPTITPSQVYSRIFDGPFQKYYQEQSYGKVNFRGTVTPWITIQQTGVYSNCGAVYVTDAPVASYLSAHSIDLAQYDRILYVINGTGGGCSGVGGYAHSINGKSYFLSESWTLFQNNFDQWSPSYPYAWSYFDYVLAHEIGHALGVVHANSLNCDGGPLTGTCTHQEYGNPFDVMGYSGTATHFNAFYKDVLGWLDPSAKLTASTSGTYSVRPIETKGGVKAVRIANPDLLSFGANPNPYYLEYRLPIGYDAVLPGGREGLLLNAIVRNGNQFPFPHLINVNIDPINSPFLGHELSAFHTGGALVDPDTGITISNVTYSSSSPSISPKTGRVTESGPEVSFSLTYSPIVCARKSPLLDIYSSYQVTVGQYGYLSIAFTNKDSFACSSNNYIVTADAPPDWTVQLGTTAFSLAPQQQWYPDMSFLIPATTTLGLYTVALHITDTGTNQTYDAVRTINLLAPPSISTTSPASGPPGTVVTLSGSGFTFSNSIILGKDSFSAYLQNIVSTDGLNLNFTIPTTINDYGSGNGALVPTPPGVYNVTLITSAGGISNTATVTVTTSTSPVIVPQNDILPSPAASKGYLGGVVSNLGKLFGPRAH